MDLLTLLTTLVLGNYGFTAWVYREGRKTRDNHLQHLDERVKVLEAGHSDENLKARVESLEQTRDTP